MKEEIQFLMNNYKLLKEQYMALYDKNISKGRYDNIIQMVENRFDYIMKTICTKIDWYDYDNGWEETSGHFEPNDYHYNEDSYINFHGQYKMPPPYSNCPDIPIKWLWEDFEDEFKKEIEDYKQSEIIRRESAKQKRAEVKIKKASMKEIIQSKLTKEELKYIKFK